MKELMDRIKYKFNNVSILNQAMTHNSLVSDINKNYQRLEFLGDRVLGLSVSTMLIEKFPNESEGELSQRFMGLVCKETVSEVALKLGLEKHAVVANEEIRTNENFLCDLCEALIAAIYIDSNFETAFEFVKRNWEELIGRSIEPPKDAKTKLQELLHVHSLGEPKYEMVEREGSEHEPIFHMSVSVRTFDREIGVGKSKKIAEQEAAKKMIEKIGEKYEK